MSIKKKTTYTTTIATIIITLIIRKKSEVKLIIISETTLSLRPATKQTLPFPLVNEMTISLFLV